MLADGEPIADAIVGCQESSLDGPRGCQLIVATPLRTVSVWEMPAGFLRGRIRYSTHIYWQDVATVGLTGKGGAPLGTFTIRAYTSQMGSISFWPEKSGMGIPPPTEQEVVAFGQRLQSRLQAIKSGAAPSSQAGGALIDQLERLAALKTSGAISEEEFQLAKRKLLSS